MGLGLSSNISVLEDLVDPLSEVGDPGVHAWLVLLGTADAPTDDAGQHEPTVGLPLHRHRPSRVSLNQRNLNQSLKPRLCPPDVFSTFQEVTFGRLMRKIQRRRRLLMLKNFVRRVLVVEASQLLV